MGTAGQQHLEEDAHFVETAAKDDACLERGGAFGFRVEPDELGKQGLLRPSEAVGGPFGLELELTCGGSRVRAVQKLLKLLIFLFILQCQPGQDFQMIFRGCLHILPSLLLSIAISYQSGILNRTEQGYDSSVLDSQRSVKLNVLFEALGLGSAGLSPAHGVGIRDVPLESRRYFLVLPQSRKKSAYL